MKQFEPINRFINSLLFLNKQEFNKYLSGILAAIGFTALCITYFINSTSTSLVARIKALHESSHKTTEIMYEFEKLQEEEAKLAAKLDEHKDFNVRTFFEQFCKQNSLSPEANWGDSVETNALALYPQFEEEIVRAVFKNQTTQTLIKLFEALEKEEMVTAKEINLTLEGSVLTAALTIAGKKHATFKKTEE